MGHARSALPRRLQPSGAIRRSIVPLGTEFTYAITLTGDGTLTLVVNGAASTFAMPPSFDGYGEYFKAGDYDQSVGTDAGVGATVKFYALRIAHAP